MSAVDLIVLSYLTRYGFPTFIVLIIFFMLIKKRHAIKKKLLSIAVANFDITFEQLTKDHKSKLFSSLYTLESANEKLKEEGVIRILEIGVRTGENLKYYPKNSHFTGIDQNVYLNKYFQSNPDKISNVRVKSLIISEKHSLSTIPDASFDAVVATLVLCNARNMDHLLREIHRVLDQDGSYFILEHSVAKKYTPLYWFQNIVSITKIWPLIFNNCHLNRNIENALRKSLFTQVNVSVIDIETKHFIFKYMKPFVIGRALKY